MGNTGITANRDMDSDRVGLEKEGIDLLFINDRQGGSIKQDTLT